ncbi:trehalose-6-phosphate synthase, partial [Mycobacterium sp. ITM-2017-0098]
MTSGSGQEVRSDAAPSAPPSASADFVVVANRLPIDIVRLPDGTTEFKQSPGGLVTALEPLLRRRRGAWIGWPGIPEEPDDPRS